MLRFAYRDAKGVETRRALSSVTESGDYIKGIQVADGAFRTFRKAQVIQYFESDAAFQASHFPDPAPDASRWQTKPPAATGPEIAFTGFPAALRAEMEAKARQAGLLVRKGVTAKLSFLCTGPNAGPAKVAAALSMGVVLVDQQAFSWMLETGEIPV